MREMTGLLYDAPAGDGNIAPEGSWKARSLALVGEWHS